MRKDLFASLTSKVAIGVAAVLLTAGTGGAVVFSNINESSSPTLPDKASDTAKKAVADAGADDDATNDDADNAANESATNNTPNDNSTDNHGAKVSAVATDKSLTCDGNHGKYVRQVAHDDSTTPTCPTTSVVKPDKSAEDHGAGVENESDKDATGADNDTDETTPGRQDADRRADQAGENGKG